MVNKLACFFTGGYTEVYGYMQLFLGKINGEFEYEQCMPNSTRKRKGTPKDIVDEYNGITGDDLLKKIYEYLKKSYIKKKFEDGVYSGILIEDDLDGRFDKENYKGIEEYENKIRKEISNILEMDCPVYFMYASPEIESWFVADWENGFGHFFTDSSEFRLFDKAVRSKFSLMLKKRIVEELLDGRIDSIERYAYLSGNYRKLSDDIGCLIDDINISINADKQNMSVTDKRRGFSYSKRANGCKILKNIDPHKIREVCNVYFSRCYLSLINVH